MRRAIGGILILLALSMTRCDRDRAVIENPLVSPPTPSTEPTPTSESKVRLYLFAGGFCGPCKEELPEVQKWLDGKMAAKKERILPLLVFTAGNPATKVATQDDAEQFKKDLGLSFETIADPRGKNYYRQYYKEGTNVPATVLLKENKEVIKIYPREKVKLDLLEADINEALK